VAGNSRVFEEAMRSGAESAWDEDWDQTVEWYQRALAQFPEDVSALNALGLAYSKLGRFEEALESFLTVNKLEPRDPVLLGRIGSTRERLGDSVEAAEAYLASADIYAAQENGMRQAAERWQDAVRVYPASQAARAKLLQYYQGQGRTDEAAQECLALARQFYVQGQADKAAEACRYALRLAPDSPDVQAVVNAINSGDPESVPLPAVSPAVPDEPFQAIFAEAVEQEGASSGLVETCVERALAELAERVFEEAMPVPEGQESASIQSDVDVLIGKAIDLQTRGEIERAIAAYEDVLGAGVEDPAVYFNLGWLYQGKQRLGSAMNQFKRAVTHRDYALASHFALSECLRESGRPDESVRHLLEALKILDISAAQPGQAGELVQLYDSFERSYDSGARPADKLVFSTALFGFFDSKDLWERVRHARRRLNQLSEGAFPLSLAEMLLAGEYERIFDSLEVSARYTSQKLHYSAVEECYGAMRWSPSYIPIHIQLAKILMDGGDLDGATAKLVAIGDSYRAKNDMHQGTAAYNLALALSPMDAVVRTKLINVYENQGEIERALDHYLVLGESHFHMAQLDEARDVYQEALPLAQRDGVDSRFQVEILRRIADIDVQRIDWKNAVSAYEQIVKALPQDEEAHIALKDLYERFERQDLVLKEIDALQRIYTDRGNAEKAVALLEEVVGERDNSIPLRARLAQTYLDAGVIEKALEHLDKLGDLQLDAGRIDDARATIQAIVALNPPNVEEYEMLLRGLR